DPGSKPAIYHMTLLRTLDANLNRASEGLRVLEDIARFLLADKDLSSSLRAARHELSQRSSGVYNRLLSGRDAESDIGAGAAQGGSEDLSRTDTLALVTANAKRVQQSLRVISELASLPELRATLDPGFFDRLRFTLYTAEKRLTSALSRRETADRIRGLYVVLDAEALAGRDVAEAARQAIAGGTRVLQLRDKVSSTRQMVDRAQSLRSITREAGALFLVNDRLDVTIAVDADGLHVGQDDLPVAVARRILPVGKIVGASARTSDQAVRACQEGADYVAVGSVFPSTGKPGALVVGLSGVAEVRKAVQSPVVAIGGIDETNVAQVIQAGADCIAVIGAVLSRQDIAAATRRMVDAIAAARNHSEE
ncbi:MAG: thiamine phosphate synthase, partial [Chloroflexota bacterium]